MSNQELIEKLEIFQNLLIGSVTNEGSDNQKYLEIREELFEIPGMKEAMPSFARTCLNIGQFWAHIKKQGNLPSYASRREYVWEAFRPIVESLQSAESPNKQMFFPKGSTHDAYTHIKSILQQATTSIFIIDGYMDGTIYTVLGTLNGYLGIRILTSKIPTDFTLEGKKFVQQHGSFTVEARTTKDFHDRFIVIDGKECYLLGASIKDAGNKSFTIIPLRDLPVVEFFRKYAEDVWSLSTPLF